MNQIILAYQTALNSSMRYCRSIYSFNVLIMNSLDSRAPKLIGFNGSIENGLFLPLVISRYPKIILLATKLI